jgi:hypothetical protein
MHTARERQKGACPFGVRGDEPLFDYADKHDLTLRQAVWYGYISAADAQALRPDDYAGLEPSPSL